MTTAGLLREKMVAAPALAALEINALSKRYRDQQALDDISFAVNLGAILGRIGPNGAGKRTLLEAVAGLLPAAAGEIIWHGTSLQPSRRREFIFYLPDGLRPWDDQHVARVLQFFAGVYAKQE